MSISTYKVTKKSAHIQVFSLDMCRLNYGLSLYRDFFSALDQVSGIFLSVTPHSLFSSCASVAVSLRVRA